MCSKRKPTLTEMILQLLVMKVYIFDFFYTDTQTHDVQMVSRIFTIPRGKLGRFFPETCKGVH